MDEAASAQAQELVTWEQWIFYSLEALVVVLVLALWHPLWIVPPYISSTPYLYLPFAWVGLFVLFVASFYKPTGSRRMLVLGIIGNIVFSLVISAIIVLTFAFAPKSCATGPSTPQVVRYQCSASFFWRTDTLTFESWPNFPLMRYIKSDSTTSSFN